MSKTRVFVYGTLKKGERNHGLLEKAEFCGAAITSRPDFVMVEFNSQSTPGRKTPGVFKASLLAVGGCYVWGEIYRVDDETLRLLDRLEGQGHHYMREKIRMDDGAPAEMYLKMVDRKDHQPHTASTHIKLIESGMARSVRDDCFIWEEAPTPAG